MQQLFGQTRPKWQGVQVFDQTVELAYASGMQTQQRLVKLCMQGQNFLEIGLGHAEDGAVAVRIGVVRAPVSVENRHIAEPDARLHVRQGDLLARDRG